MTTSYLLPCDGCGQPASPEHLARRLQRLEWSTRYRPVHIQTLLLSAVAPAPTSAFVYSGAATLDGEAALLLDALQIPWEGKSADCYLGEFQKRGLFLMHVLECPLEPQIPPASAFQALLETHLHLAMARIRRSLKPKRVALVAPELSPLTAQLTESSLGCPVLLHLNKPFEIMKKEGSSEIAAFRLALEDARSGSM
jgi:hypothetical protein